MALFTSTEEDIEALHQLVARKPGVVEREVILLEKEYKELKHTMTELEHNISTHMNKIAIANPDERKANIYAVRQKIMKAKIICEKIKKIGDIPEFNNFKEQMEQLTDKLTDVEAKLVAKTNYIKEEFEEDLALIDIAANNSLYQLKIDIEVEQRKAEEAEKRIFRD